MLCLLPLQPSSQLAQQKPTYLLRITDRIGQVSRYRLVFDIQMRAEYQGSAELDVRARQLMETLAKGMGLRTAVEYEQRLVKVAADGTRTFEVRWRDYDFTGDIGGQPIAPPPQHLESTRELLSRVALVSTTPTGRTLAVEAQHPGLAGMAKRFEQMEEAMPTYLPEQAVGAGDRWTSVANFPLEITAGGTGSMALELEHELVAFREGREGPIALIALAGDFSRLQGIEAVAGGVPMHVETSLTGSTLFDVARGRFVEGQYEIDMFALHAADGVEIQLIGHANGRLELMDTR